MITEYKLENHFTFKKAFLKNLTKGLIVLTGPSGSGKSVLMNSILSNLSLKTPEAKLSESIVDFDLNLEEYGLEKEDLYIFKQVKKDKNRYFVNNQSVSKNAINKISNSFVRYLSLKDYTDFEKEKLINLLDSIISKKDKSYKQDLLKYTDEYSKLLIVQKKLKIIEEEESQINDLKEYAQFEIEKIEKLNPILGEDEDLEEIKNSLSSSENLGEQIEGFYQIFDYESKVYKFLEELKIDTSDFENVFSELRDTVETTRDKINNLEEVDIEEVLTKLENIKHLNNKYGSISEALDYLEKKREEVNHYNNISFEKEELKKEEVSLFKEVNKQGESISKKRNNNFKLFESKFIKFTDLLYLENINIKLEQSGLSSTGIDEIKIAINKAELAKISTGEFNRLRLALLALKTTEIDSGTGGILMLDEIDANLSGEESMSVAKVLKILSKTYQIFAISHQPQLTSCADIHILVTKENNISEAKTLNKDERIQEISRMISGTKKIKEALDFAKNLINQQQ